MSLITKGLGTNKVIVKGLGGSNSEVLIVTKSTAGVTVTESAGKA